MVGELEVLVKGENSLEIISENGDLIIGTTLDLSGGAGNNQDRGKSGPGGWAGGEVNGKGLGPEVGFLV